MGTRHFSMRIDAGTLERLEREAKARRQSKSSVAEQMIEEGLRMRRHPAIVFRDNPAGRTAGMAASGLEVWEIVNTVHPHGGDIEAAAKYLTVGAWLVQAAMDYYAEYRDEIDEWIADNERVAEEMMAAERARA